VNSSLRLLESGAVSADDNCQDVSFVSSYVVLPSAVRLHFRSHSPRCLEHPRIDLDLFHAGSEERLQCRRYPRLLACARRSIDEQMWEVTAGRLVHKIRQHCKSTRQPERIW
jgi:hypothetical protein